MTEKNIEYIWKKRNKKKLWLKGKQTESISLQGSQLHASKSIVVGNQQRVKKHRRASLAIFSKKNVKKAQNKEHFQNDF